MKKSGPKTTVVERIAESLGILESFGIEQHDLPSLTEPGDLTKYPPPSSWDDWEEYEAKGWARKEKKKYSIVPTTCFNCESACGLLAYVEKDSGQVRKFEGNPYHPG
ncbi:MAG: formate dehydrogenase, partial [Flavobacteriales bacterium]|nr:formate dehydrogenase [Flavobacteriales bacterium]